MPSKNSVKTYVGENYYHLYNRGVNKRKIFKDQQDASVFLSYLKTYLLQKDEKSLMTTLSNPQSTPFEKDQALKLLQLNNFYGRINLICYCLMQNHFHLLVYQKNDMDIDAFMQSAGTRYTIYFNRRHKRVGPLFQGRYKAVIIKSDEQLLYLTRYIHRNPFARSDLGRSDLFQQPSSYKVYLGETKQEWVKPNVILSNFSKSGFNSYRSFVEDEDPDLEAQSSVMLEKLILDEEEK